MQIGKVGRRIRGLINVGFTWKRIRSGEWIGRNGELTYTIKQSSGARFYVIRNAERAPFAAQRSLALAKAMAEEDAGDCAARIKRTPA